jgi:phospholipid/cholesterol/gamma-HCH transport system permease protein
MQALDQPENAVAIKMRPEAGGRVSLALEGRLDMKSTAVCWRELDKRLHSLEVKSLDVDASQLDFSGGIGIALLRYLSEGGMTPGAQVSIHGLSKELQRLLDTFTTEDFRAYQPHKPANVRIPEEIGASIKSLLQDLREQVAFIGSVVMALPAAIVRPRRMRWGEVRRIIETAGANALPVIGVFSFLVGLVLALEGSKPLAQFGAQLYIADVIGFSSIRDTGPLVTAVMLAGRSGSAFAAELGTMKVNQELDALTTMGLSPVRFLVVQRIVGALILTPLLTLYAMVMGILGGVMLMRFQGFPPMMIYHQIIERVHMGDLFVGLGKALVFGIIIGGVGCLRGLQTKEGPQAVGVSTTRSVVASILLVIVANTLFSAAQYVITP